MKTNRYRSWNDNIKNYIYWNDGIYESVELFFDWSIAEQLVPEITDKNCNVLYEGDCFILGAIDYYITYYKGSFVLARVYLEGIDGYDYQPISNCKNLIKLGSIRENSNKEEWLDFDPKNVPSDIFGNYKVAVNGLILSELVSVFNIEKIDLDYRNGCEVQICKITNKVFCP